MSLLNRPSSLRVTTNHEGGKFVMADQHEARNPMSPLPWLTTVVPEDESELRGCALPDDMSGPEDKVEHIDLYFEALPVDVERNEPGAFVASVDTAAAPRGYAVACIVGMGEQDRAYMLEACNAYPSLVERVRQLEDALRAALAVLSGDAFSKSELISALEAGRKVLLSDRVPDPKDG